MQNKLGIIALESAASTGKRVNEILKEWRGVDNFLIPCECPRFGSGEGKGIVRESVRDKDIYIIVDVLNNSLTYKMDGEPNRMSPDDHYM
ncbi:MAG: ribose-phosphate pyrophosphokinase-like domain-containing protein, partial [Butyrivibrio sp.]